MLQRRVLLLLPCLLAWARPGNGGEQRVYALQVYDLPAPGTIEYAPFQAMLEDHPQIRYTRQSQLLLKGLERGSLLMSIAGGTAPDILRPYEHENKSWIRQGFLEKLDQYIYRDVDGDGRYTEGVDEVIWKPFLYMPREVRDLILEDGHIYLVPRFQWFQFFMYRKDIFRENGLDPDKRIETFEEFDRVCKILTDPKAKITGAKRARGRYGIGIYPNGWIWQGWLYGYGGQCMKWLKTCPKCGTETEFPQDETAWACGKCGADLRQVRAKERAAFNSQAGYNALKLWQDQIWAPFTKCLACGEPATLGDAQAQLSYPLKLVCAKCRKPFTVAGEQDVIRGCA
ncbi:MAG: extracellular solute-binding protein, partial [Planctomycetota bacterium]